jgi:hypothetical protein
LFGTFLYLINKPELLFSNLHLFANANDIIWSDGGTFTVTLPHASGSTGYQITVSKYDGAGTLTVNTLSGNINGASSVTYSNNTYHTRQFISNGTNWMIESHFV